MSDNQLPPTTLAAGSSAEVQAAAFADDDRIHFDRTAGTWRYEDEEGNEMEYDATKGAWAPLVRPHCMCYALNEPPMDITSSSRMIS